MKSKLMLMALAAIFVFGLAAAGSADAETVLRMGTISNDANQLDPHISVKSQDKILFPMLFNGLVRFKPGSADLGDMEPDLAESWESSPDGLVWTFKLRKGVKFHGGYGTLTADDVVYSLARAADTAGHHIERRGKIVALQDRHRAGQEIPQPVIKGDCHGRLGGNSLQDLLQVFHAVADGEGPIVALRIGSAQLNHSAGSTMAL